MNENGKQGSIRLWWSFTFPAELDGHAPKTIISTDFFQESELQLETKQITIFYHKNGSVVVCSESAKPRKIIEWFVGWFVGVWPKVKFCPINKSTGTRKCGSWLTFFSLPRACPGSRRLYAGGRWWRHCWNTPAPDGWSECPGLCHGALSQSCAAPLPPALLRSLMDPTPNAPDRTISQISAMVLKIVLLIDRIWTRNQNNIY